MLSLLLAFTLSFRKPLKDNDCDACKMAVGIIRDAINQGYSDEQIKQALKESCPTMPPQYIKMCEEFLKQIDGILADVHAGKSDDEICKDHSFCNFVSRRPSKKNGLGCDLCKALVSQIEKMLLDKKTEEEIKAYLHKQCEQLVDPLRGVCNNIADLYVPIILEYLEQGLEKLHICQKIGFCQPERKVKIARRNDFEANAMSCEMCKTLVAYVEQIMVSTKVEEEIEALVSKLCVKFPAPYNTLCQSLVHQYIPVIMQWLEQGLEKVDICAKLGMCEKKARKNDFEANAISCDMCKTLVAYVEQIMVSTKVEEEIEALVSKLCVKFPAPYNTLCQSLVHQYIPVIMQWLEQGLEKVDICAKLGMCEKKARKNDFEANAMSCEMCKTLVAYIEKIMVSTKVEEEIEALVSKLCVKFPAPYNTLCQSLVHQYIPVIMQWLEQGIEHIDICAKLGMCEKKARKNDFEANAISCDMCKTLVAYVEKIMVSTKVEEEIEALVSKLCVKFPAPYNTLCQSLVHQYIPVIMQWLEQGLEKVDICAKLGMCEKKARKNDFEANAMSCEMCKTLVAYVEQIMVSTKVEEEIEALVSKLCVKFPAPYNTLCQSLVHQYIPVIMQWLEQGLEKVDICAKLGMCEKKARKNDFEANAISCEMCKSVIAYVEQIMVSTKVEEEIEALVSKLCVKFPAPYNTLCQSLVHQYTPVIMQWLEQGLEKVDICAKLGMCEKKSLKNEYDFTARLPITDFNGVSCDVCQSFFKWAEGEVKEYSVAGLWKLVHEKCPSVPYIASFCKLITQENINTIVDLILSKIPPQKCCALIHVC